MTCVGLAARINIKYSTNASLITPSMTWVGLAARINIKYSTNASLITPSMTWVGLAARINIKYWRNLVGKPEGMNSLKKLADGLAEIRWKAKSGLMWLRIGTNWGMVWTVITSQVLQHFLANWGKISFSGSTLLHSVTCGSRVRVVQVQGCWLVLSPTRKETS